MLALMRLISCRKLCGEELSGCGESDRLFFFEALCRCAESVGTKLDTKDDHFIQITIAHLASLIAMDSTDHFFC